MNTKTPDPRRAPLRRDLKDGLCELCSARLTPADLKAGHSICAQCRTRFPRKLD